MQKIFCIVSKLQRLEMRKRKEASDRKNILNSHRDVSGIEV